MEDGHLKVYEYILNEIPQYPFTFKDYMETIVSILSRRFGVREKDKKEIESWLVPLADMANHGNDPEVTYYKCPIRNGFIFTANKDINKGT
jgi:hypothetical protein